MCWEGDAEQCEPSSMGMGKERSPALALLEVL